MYPNSFRLWGQPFQAGIYDEGVFGCSGCGGSAGSLLGPDISARHEPGL